MQMFCFFPTIMWLFIVIFCNINIGLFKVMNTMSHGSELYRLNYNWRWSKFDQCQVRLYEVSQLRTVSESRQECMNERWMQCQLIFVSHVCRKENKISQMLFSADRYKHTLWIVCILFSFRILNKYLFLIRLYINIYNKKVISSKWK